MFLIETSLAFLLSFVFFVFRHFLRFYQVYLYGHDSVIFHDRSLVEELRKILCALWQGSSATISPDELFAVVWKVVPRFR